MAEEHKVTKRVACLRCVWLDRWKLVYADGALSDVDYSLDEAQSIAEGQMSLILGIPVVRA